MPVKTAVIYYSATGGTHKLAEAIAEGAREAGSEVRVLKVKELAPEQAIASNEGWGNHVRETSDIPEATLADLEWADAIIMGSPTRYGGAASQLRQFIDLTGPLWAKGALVDKIASAFCSTATLHGGQEITIHNILNAFYHWGCIVVTPGYVDPIQFAMGNPYGVSFTSQNGAVPPDETAIAAARFQGRRVAETAARFVASRPS